MFFLDGDRDAYERVLKERKETCDKNKKTLPSVWEGGRDPEQPSGSAGRVGPRRSIEDQKAHVPLPSHAAVHSASLLMPSDKRRIILPISRENPRFHQNHPFYHPSSASSFLLDLTFTPSLPLSLSFSPSLSLPRSKSTSRGPRREQISHTHSFDELLASSRSRRIAEKGRGWREGAREKSRFLSFPRESREGLRRWGALGSAADRGTIRGGWTTARRDRRGRLSSRCGDGSGRRRGGFSADGRRGADPSRDERESREKSGHWAVVASGRPTTRCASTDAATHCADVATTTTSSPRRPSEAPLAPLLPARRATRGGEGGIDQSNARRESTRYRDVEREEKELRRVFFPFLFFLPSWNYRGTLFLSLSRDLTDFFLAKSALTWEYVNSLNIVRIGAVLFIFLRCSFSQRFNFEREICLSKFVRSESIRVC